MRNMEQSEMKLLNRGYGLIVNAIDEHFSNSDQPFTELQFRKAELIAYEDVPLMEDYCEMLRKEIVPLLEE
jgi:hypothetical protein